jgi:Ethanolamine utilization protein EutJ (predicted chaperonin)
VFALAAPIVVNGGGRFCVIIAFNSIFYADDTTGIAHILKTEEERKKFYIESDEYNKKNHADIYEKFLTFTYLSHDVPIKQTISIITEKKQLQKACCCN